jgi:hypothetical protein
MGYQEFFLSASVLGAAIAPDDCLHNVNMRSDRLKLQRPGCRVTRIERRVWMCFCFRWAIGECDSELEERKTDMICKSLGVVLALSVFLSLQPFSIESQAQENGSSSPPRAPRPPEPYSPSPATGCGLLAADYATPISDGREKEWLRLCNLAAKDDCEGTAKFVQSEVHQSIPGLTCHGP